MYYYGATQNIDFSPPSGGDIYNVADAPKWYEFVTNFDNSLAQYTAALSDLQSVASNVPQSGMADYQALMAKMQTAGVTLNALQTVRDDVAAWLTAIGSNTYPGASTLNGMPDDIATGVASGLIVSGLAGLGQVSNALRSVASALTALAAIGAVIEAAISMYQYYAFGITTFPPSSTITNWLLIVAAIVLLPLVFGNER